MNLLALETSADFCSVAAMRGDAVSFRHEVAGQSQAEIILGIVDGVLAEARLSLGDLDGVAYGAGPGSFTGLRIACGVTQGLALSRGIPVVGVGTLLALVEEAARELPGERFVACLDARMGEVYHAAYRRSGAGWEEVSAPGVYRPDAAPALAGEGWVGCGNGFAAYGGRVAARHAGRLSAIRAELAPTARAVLALALPRFARGEARDAAAALPVYLREKVALKTGER